jgi:hypothetical protein
MAVQLVTVGGLNTIKGHGHEHWEWDFDGQGTQGRGDVGPCYATAELVPLAQFADAQLVANNQGAIYRIGGADVQLAYTVDIDNTDATSSQYFLRVALLAH